MSALTWLDFSDKERQHALDILDLFREKGTVDELGIGTVRDALADILFPGTSTIMTRARYYLFIPWIYQLLEKRRTSSSEVNQRARKLELDLVESLLESDDHDGLIGRDAKRNLKRLPSTIYWNGLGVLGIRRFEGSRDRFHRDFERFWRNGGDALRGHDGHVITGGRQHVWDPSLPERPASFPDGAALALTPSEAEYLQERIIQSAPESYFAHLLRDLDAFDNMNLPWEESRDEQIPERAGSDLAHARNFSDAMHGAALLYNLMLAEKKKAEKEREDYSRRYADWARRVNARMRALEEWSRLEFWQLIDRFGARVPLRTRGFITTWLDTLIGGDPKVLRNDSQVRKTITVRERQLKGSLARLDSARALERWGGASSAEPLDFRWNRPTRRIIGDIKSALDAA